MALQRIERTATDVLRPMRGLVAVLRAPETTTAPVARRRGDLRELVDRFGDATGIAVTLTVEDPVTSEVHRKAVQRVTQEALTNVRRHAARATRADVRVALRDSAVQVSIADDGDRLPTPQQRARAAASACSDCASEPPRSAAA